jgi:hypothetical protein
MCIDSTKKIIIDNIIYNRYLGPLFLTLVSFSISIHWTLALIYQKMKQFKQSNTTVVTPPAMAMREKREEGLRTWKLCRRVQNFSYKKKLRSNENLQNFRYFKNYIVQTYSSLRKLQICLNLVQTIKRKYTLETNILEISFFLVYLIHAKPSLACFHGASSPPWMLNPFWRNHETFPQNPCWTLRRGHHHYALAR